MTTLYTLARPLIHCLPPETAHTLGLKAAHLLPPAPAVRHPELATPLFGLKFPGAVGLAAGFDKNAVAPDALLAQGFSFVEVGTVTPKPQADNPKPRLFRLPGDEAVINRMGFNNDGVAAFAENLSKRDRSKGIVGVNIGKNKDSKDAAADYVECVHAVYPYADYIAINISSPNTPGLRALQKRAALDALLAELVAAREASASVHQKRLPLLLKVAPDLDHQEKEDIADKAMVHGIDGLIVGNTTLTRPLSLKSWSASEQGGLSGKPLFPLSTQMLSDFYKLTSGRLPLIGVGGIASATDAYVKIRAGASLVQLYTAIVYQGFGVARAIEEELCTLLRRDGFTHISQAVGSDVR